MVFSPLVVKFTVRGFAHGGLLAERYGRERRGPTVYIVLHLHIILYEISVSNVIGVFSCYI